MKRASDIRLLVTVLALPSVLAFGMGLLGWAVGEPFGPGNVAMYMMSILLFSAITAQSLGRKVLETGPRALAQYFGVALAMFGMLIVGKAPLTEMTLGQMLAQWWWPPAIVFLGLSFAMIKPLRALRRHPRALWIMARPAAIMAAISAVLAAFVAAIEDGSIAQTVWFFFVYVAAISSAVVTVLAYRWPRKTPLGKIARFLSQAIPVVAMMYVVFYAMKLGSQEGLSVMPYGGIIGSSIGVMWALNRKRGNKGGA